MVQLRNYLKSESETLGVQKDLPLLNSLFVERFTAFNPYGMDNNFKTYMKWARRSPELMGFLNIIATDMLSDQIEFTPIKEDTSGRNRVLRARTFWDANRGIEVAEQTLYDGLITGIGYNWIGALSNKQLKEFCETVAEQLFPGIEEKELEQKANMMLERIVSEKNADIAKKFRHVASSTMTKHTDEYEVIKYVQRVGVNYKEFTTKEIIEFNLFPLDGKVYPFPPMEAILAEVYLLWLITQNYISFFENGGQPDNVFILPKELAGSKNHTYLIDELRKYKKIQNKHGNLVFTGDISIEQLMDAEKAMEHKDLGLYLIGVLAMMYGIPVSRIPFLVGKAASGGDAGGLADSGYWRKISVWQSKMEAAYNNKLWNPYFGVNMKFRRGYLQDEVRETQNEVQRNSVAEQRINLGLWTVEAAGKYLNIEQEEIQKAQTQKKVRAEEELKSGMLLQNSRANKDVMPEPDHQAKAAQKSSTQKDNQIKAGGKKVNP